MRMIALIYFCCIACNALAQGKTDSPAPIVKEKEDISDPYPATANPENFPGGTEGLKKFMRENICYPEELSKNNITGRVYIIFDIDTTGQVYNVKIKKGLHKEPDSLCIEAVKRMPRWKVTAKNKGKKVKEHALLPVKFERVPAENKEVNLPAISCEELRKKRMAEKRQTR